MPASISRLAAFLKQIGEIQVNEWDFRGFMNRDIRELDISGSLHRLGQTKVMEWDFRSVMPAVARIAHKEVDLVGIFSRAANCRVMEWDFRTPSGGTRPAAAQPVNEAEAAALGERLTNYLRYVVTHLIDEPEHARIVMSQFGYRAFRFCVVLTRRDLKMLVGRRGYTAAAIRNTLKAAAARHGAYALLHIQSHEETKTAR